MEILSAIAAMYLGITLLPCKVLYYAIRYAFLGLIWGGERFIFSPIRFSLIFLNDLGLGAVLSFLIAAFIVAPVATMVFEVVLTFAIFYLFLMTSIDMITTVFSGLVAGFADGLAGFWRIWDTPTYCELLGNQLLAPGHTPTPHSDEIIPERVHAEFDFSVLQNPEEFIAADVVHQSDSSMSDAEPLFYEDSSSLPFFTSGARSTPTPSAPEFEPEPESIPIHTPPGGAAW